MRRSTLCTAIIAALAACFLALPAHAQATRTWVSGVGADDNPCSRTAPCKTYAGAISKTAKDGEISTLDPGGFGAVTITKSITINGTPGAGYGSILATLSNGVTINITDAADARRTVRLNWLDINGAGTGINGIRIMPGNLGGTSVVVENTNIDGFGTRGISDERTNGGKLVVSDTTIRHVVGSGIHIVAGGVNQNKVMLSNVRVHNAAVAGLLANGGAKVMVSNSVFSGSTTGIDAQQANTEVTVDNSTIAHSTTGILQAGGAVVRLSNSNVAFNTTGVSGTVNSFSNNRFVSSPGGTITPIGVNSSDTGQQ
jgi:hypothetical protein